MYDALVDINVNILTLIIIYNTGNVLLKTIWLSFLGCVLASKPLKDNIFMKNECHNRIDYL